MKYIHLIKQHDEKDCGAACLSMVLQHFGRKLTWRRTPWKARRRSCSRP